MENYRNAKKGGCEGDVIIKKTCTRCKGCGIMVVKERKPTIRTKPCKKDDLNNMKCNRCYGYKDKTEFLKKDNMRLYKTCNHCRAGTLNSYYLKKKNV